MRNDVKLGFAIGGVLLAVLIVYVLVVPGGSSSQPKKVSTSSQQNGGASSASASKSETGKVTLEPVVPPPVPNTSSTQPSVPVVPPPAYANAGSSKTTPAIPPAKTDPFASKSDDWNTILNQQPMLMTETPVAATGGSRSAAPVTPVTPAAASSSEAKSPGSADSTASSASTDTASSASTTQPAESSSTPVASSAGSSASGSSASSGSPGTSASPGARTHRIQAGETLSAISTAAYGSPAYYPAIVRANPGIDPNHLKVGTTINLPDASTVKPSGTAAAAGAASDTASAQHASAHIPGTAAPTLDSSKEYRVQAGDSLHKISIRLYGRSDQADKIYQLNKQTIGDDPHRLKIGQVLALPAPPTVSTTSR